MISARGLPAALLMSLTTIGPVAAQSLNGKLVDGFDGSDFAPEGGLYYRDNDEQRAGTVEFQNEVKRTGTGALKLSVRPNCPQDAANCSERAEIWEKTALREPYDKPVWYGFAVKFAEPVPLDDHRYLIAQWKREIDSGADGDFSPFLALRMKGGRLFATVETNYQEPASTLVAASNGCPASQVPVWPRSNVNQMRALVATDGDWSVDDGAEFSACTDKVEVIDRGNSLPSPTSGWIDFAILTKPGPDGTGHIEIFANDKWVVTVKGHIGHNDKGLGDNQYFKFGPYRAGNNNDWTLFYDDFRRSARCEDVLADQAACAAIN